MNKNSKHIYLYYLFLLVIKRLIVYLRNYYEIKLRFTIHETKNECILVKIVKSDI